MSTTTQAPSTQESSRQESSRQKTPRRGRHENRCRRCSDGSDPADAVGPSAPSRTYVPEGAAHVVFEVDGFDCLDCPDRIEAALDRLDGVHGATASYGTETVGVYYDPDVREPADFVDRLTDVGRTVESRDDAFRNRRARQWAGARFAAGVLAGLMALVPYASVVYPIRFEWLLSPEIAALLRSGLATTGGFNFYLNVAVLSGIVLRFAGKPMLDRARAALSAGTVTPSLVATSVAVPAYLYSAAVVLVGITAAVDLSTTQVHFDVVVLIVLAWLAVQHGLGLETPTDTTDPDRRSTSRVDASAAAPGGSLEDGTAFEDGAALDDGVAFEND
ncbi:cation transporter [Halopenitus persicus]|uniref:cation transporter n=1 Tax=Halopenitus persicus TaxID=1048396 RepID=UPI0012FDAC93|nr:cation transporter [Halopenitus persicus]